MLELVLRLAVSLGVVLGLFWLVARTGARKLGGSRGLMRVHGRQSLSRTASLAVVEVGSRVLVVGVSEGGVRLLTELDPLEVAPVPADGEDQESDEPDGSRSPALRGIPWRRGVARPGRPALGGSLLSAQTWSQAWSAATAKSSTAQVVDGATHE